MFKFFFFRLVLIFVFLISFTSIYYDFKEHNINTKLQTLKFNHESIIRLFNSSMHICHLGEKEIELKTSKLNNEICIMKYASYHPKTLHQNTKIVHI